MFFQKGSFQSCYLVLCIAMVYTTPTKYNNQHVEVSICLFKSMLVLVFGLGVGYE